MLPDAMMFYGRICGQALARAHARSGDRVSIAAYLGSSDRFDNAISDFAETCAEQNVRDHAELARAAKTGRVLAETGIWQSEDPPMASLLPADSVAERPTLDPTLNDVAKRVHEEFDDHLGPSAVDECLDQITARLDGATVRSFIPLLVRRYVREELQARVRQT